MRISWHDEMLPERAFRTVGKKLVSLEGGKGSSPPPPDYGPLAAASREAAQMGLTLGREQLAQNQAQYERNMTTLAPVIAANINNMTQTAQQGKDYYDYNVSTFRPMERGLAADAQNFSTAGARETFATRAASDLEAAQANEEAQQARAMAAMGVNPNSAKAQALSGLARVQKAADRAGATSRARVQADQLGWAKRLDAAGLGRGLAGASTAAYGASTAAGQGATSTQLGASGQYLNGMNNGYGTIMQGQGMQIQGLGSVLGAQTSAYNAGLAADAAGALDIGGLMSGAAALWTASDPRLKENIELVGKTDSGFRLYEFNYIYAPERRFRGVMADEIKDVLPEAVAYDSNGYMVVDYDMLGIEMVEV